MLADASEHQRMRSDNDSSFLNDRFLLLKSRTTENAARTRQTDQNPHN